MDLNIGIDIIEIERIEKLYNKYKDKFLNKILTQKEIDILPIKYKRKIEFIAGRWAGKESIKKALVNQLSWKEVEILKDKESGKPLVLKPKNIKLSISHIKDLAIAVAVFINC